MKSLKRALSTPGHSGAKEFGERKNRYRRAAPDPGAREFDSASEIRGGAA